MKKIISVVIFSFIFIFLLLESTAVHAKEIRGVTEKTIKVGLICDLTGPASGVFNGYLQSIRTYFKHVNDQGGLRGRKLKLIVENDRYTIPGSIAAYKKLVYRDKVLAILGMGGSGQHKALYDRIEKDRIPVITLSASWHVTRPIKRYSFQPINDAGDEMKLIANYLINVQKVKNLRLAFVYADLEAGKMALDQLEKSMNHYGRELVGREILGIGDIDASTQILALKRVKASHVAFIVAGSGILSLFRDAKKLAYHPTFVATFHTIGEDIVRTAGDSARKLISVGGYSSWYEKEPGVAKLKKITLKYHPESKYIEKYATNRYYSKGWLTAMTLVEGAKRAEGELNGETLVSGLETFQDLDTGGLSPPLSYGPKKRKATDSGKFYKADVEKGYFVPITDWMKPMH